MNRKIRKIELMTNDGRMIFSFLLGEREVGMGNSNDEEPTMTEAQEKYMLKLLAERGITGDEAKERLLKLFNVDSLKKVPKLRACVMIKDMLKEKGDAQNGGDKPAE